MTSVEYFDHTCQPCDGDREKNEECLIDDCVPFMLANGGTDEPTPAYLHHHCCEDSSAFRVSFWNRCRIEITMSFRSLEKIIMAMYLVLPQDSMVFTN